MGGERGERGKRCVVHLLVVEDGTDDADMAVCPESVESPGGWRGRVGVNGDECDVSSGDAHGLETEKRGEGRESYSLDPTKMLRSGVGEEQEMK